MLNDQHLLELIRNIGYQIDECIISKRAVKDEEEPYSDFVARKQQLDKGLENLVTYIKENY